MKPKSNINKGKDLERRVARLEFAQGSTVVMRFPVRVYDHQGPEIITDIDVLSVNFDLKLRDHVTIIECKSVRGQKGEADRLLVLAGLREFFNANLAVLVRLSASSRGREIARQLDIDLWDSKQLEQLEESHRWVPERFGPIAGYKYEELHSEASETLKSIGNFPHNLFFRLCFDAFVDQPYRILQSLIELSEFLADGSILPRVTCGVVMTNALQALSMAALRTASQFDALGQERTKNMIESGVTTGSPHIAKSLNLAKSIDDFLHDQIELVHKTYVAAGTNRQKVDMVSIQQILKTPLPWIDRFMDLAFRCRARPDLGRNLPRVIQIACFDALFRDINWKAPAFDHLFTPEHRQLVIVTLNTLEEIIGSNIEVLHNLRRLPFERNVESIKDRDEVFNSEERRNSTVHETDTEGQQYLL